MSRRRAAADAPRDRPRRPERGATSVTPKAADAGTTSVAQKSSPAATATAARPVQLARRHSGRILVALVTAAVLLATGYAWNGLAGLQSSVTRLGDLSLGKGADGAVDILLVGTDSRTDAHGNPLSAGELAELHAGDDVATNTDTILLIRIPNDGSSATAISIPRDSYVDVPGIGKTKINSAYGSTKEIKREAVVNAGGDPTDAERQGVQAGRKALIDSVANLTGVQVDHYAEVGLLGFVLLTNAVGGVPVCLKGPVNEPFSGAHFRAGEQTLNGSQALSFVRQRHELPRGDLDRITRQQVYMASLAQKVLSAGTLSNPGKLGDLEDAVSRSVVIDDGWDIVKFTEQLKDLSGGKVKFATIPVVSENGWSDDGDQSVVQVDPTQVHAFTNSLLNKKAASTAGQAPDTSSYTVDVSNTGSVAGLATNVATIVTNKGFQKGAVGNAESADTDSIIYAHTDDSAAKNLAKQLGGLPVKADPAMPSGRMKVVLTDSYAGPGSVSDTGSQPDSTPTPSSAAPSSADNSPSVTAGSSQPQCVN
ncbi:LCP family protein [Williamsia sterculiae]|uniref:Transcriptional attenuator, LytR family n=1 Tax=Williamsia sterculiae TaxID=1344003 RepID=A0A1N7E0C8_9NOCA|nr:LCP family protein [Williamsia sterculiae]SIR81529.1 transcriptional attenuator, LytR family [Williamsia sterculiae]